MTTTGIIRSLATGSLALAAAGIAATAMIGCGAMGIGATKPDVRFCAVAEGSLSTLRPDIRTAYANAFGLDVEWYAKQPGTSPMCFILAVNDPTSNPIAELPIRALHPDSPDADSEVAGNVEIAKTQFAQVLAAARDLQGTPLLEALYALAVRGNLRADDTISVYSDMRQDSGNVKSFNLVRLGNPAKQAQAIEKAIELLRRNGILPDGQDGRPSLDGVRLVVPAPSASADVSEVDNKKLEAARQAVAKEFWDAWADAVGADLAWGEPASGGRT